MTCAPLKTSPAMKVVNIEDIEGGAQSTHVPADTEDSSGHTNSNSDSDDSSMIDDSNIMSTEEIEYLAKYVAKALPLTAKSLTSPPPLMTKSPKRNRVIPSSSSSPPAA